jgi:di/tricarboxylate transporter
MIVKQFLKPDGNKVAITAIIVIILFLVEGFIIFLNTCFCPYVPSICQGNSYYLPWEYCCPETYCGKPDLLTSIMIAIYYSSIIAGTLMISYFLSCLLVWIYDKIGKKK